VAGGILGAAAGVLFLAMMRESGGALSAVVQALHGLGEGKTGQDAVHELEERLDVAAQRPADG